MRLFYTKKMTPKSSKAEIINLFRKNMYKLIYLAIKLHFNLVSYEEYKDIQYLRFTSFVR